MPITIAMCVVLGFLILSYQTIMSTLGRGAYLVTKDNFGPTVAQVAGASLLTDYVLTVAVSASAGTAALQPAFDAGAVPRRSRCSSSASSPSATSGVKESGRIFAVPTYFFMVNMAILLSWGAWRYTAGDLPGSSTLRSRARSIGAAAGVGVLLGVKLFDVLHAFRSPVAPRSPAWRPSPTACPPSASPRRNARQTLVIMGTGLGVMFLGISALAAAIHVTPFENGSPTVIAQIGEAVYGHARSATRCSTCCRPAPC